MEPVIRTVGEHWQVWLLSVLLVIAAVIDGWKLKVPNWLTYPLIISGWILSLASFGWEGLAWSLVGTAVGFGLLAPAYAIGGMGAGDVKLLAGVGAWVWGTNTFYAFCACAIFGGVISVAMVLIRGQWKHHYRQFFGIATEILVIGNPETLSTIAAQRKSSMMLLPYGIPIALGTIAYFIWSGMLA